MEDLLDSNLLLVISNMLLLLLLVFRRAKISILTPTILLPTIIFVFIILGNINLTYFQKSIGWYKEIHPSEGNAIALISLAIMSSLLILYPTKKDFNQSKISIIQLRNLDIFLISLTFIGTLLNILNYNAIGGILIFKSGLTGYERFNLNLPFEKALNLSSFLICPCIIRISLFKERFHFFFGLLLINVLMAFGLGHRHLIFMPSAAAIIFLFSNGFIKRKYVIAAILTFPLLVIGASFLRGDSNNLAYSSSDSIFGNEYRDYLRQRQEKIPLQYGKTMLPVILNPIPKELYSLTGTNKEAYSIYSAYILEDIWGNNSGQRTGIWGEFLMNFGDPGILIGFGLFTLLIFPIEKSLFRQNFNMRRKFICSYFYTLLVFSIIGSWASIGDDLGTFGILYYLCYLFCFKTIHCDESLFNLLGKNNDKYITAESENYG